MRGAWLRLCGVVLAGMLLLGCVSSQAPQDDGARIQTAIDLCAMGGGGEVRLPEGTFVIRNTILLRSGVHLRGAGAGRTVLTSPPGDYPGKTVQGAGVFATLAMAAVNGAGVHDLTVDHSAGRVGNGIVIVAGAAGRGTPSTHCEITGCEVLLSRDSGHAYAIWNLKSHHSRILNNRVDGGFTTFEPVDGDPQEGIETFGGSDVLIQGNTVTGIHNNGIYVCSSSLTGPVTDVRILGNTVERCGRSIAIQAESAARIQISGNHCEDAWDGGLYITVGPSGSLEGLEASDNTVLGVGADHPAAAGAGIYLYGDPSAGTRDILITRNTVSEARKASVGGISVFHFPGVVLRENAITNCAGTGIYALGSHRLTIEANRIEGTGGSAIHLGDAGNGVIPEACYVVGNLCLGYNQGGSALAGILLSPARNSVVDGNTFLQANFCYPVWAVGFQSDGVCIGPGNTLLFEYLGNPVFRNDGTNPSGGPCPGPEPTQAPERRSNWGILRPSLAGM